jgi:two-component sensor histidine kinase
MLVGSIRARAILSTTSDGMEKGNLWALASVGFILVALNLSALPWANIALPKQPLALPVQATAIIITDGITALLLFNQFRTSGAPHVLMLGGIFEFSALMALAQFVTFPGVFSIFDLVPQVSPWLWAVWHIGVPVGALMYWAMLSPRAAIVPETRGRTTTITVLALPAAALLVTVFAVFIHDWLPLFFTQGDNAMSQATWRTYFCGAEIILALVAAGLLLTVQQADQLLTRWFALALIALACEIFCTLILRARFTVYWWFARTDSVIASTIVLSILIAQLNRMYSAISGQSSVLSITNIMLERGVAERTADLTKALNERNLLLREVYHRVKNNLQLVDSLLMMQGRKIEDPQAREALVATRGRISALGLVHQQLMGSADLKTFDIMPFFDALSKNILESGGSDHVNISVDACELDVDLDFAVPLGLLVTELVTNSLKHAFPYGVGTISVILRNDPPGSLVLIVSDDGIGTAEKPAAGLGSRIITNLVVQLEGTMVVRHDHGTTTEIRFARPDPA